MSDVVKRAKEKHKRDLDHWSPIYDKGKNDLKFLSDADDAQWDAKDKKDRQNSGRPALTVDQLSQFVHQVANDIRMNTPTINVIPAGEDSDVDTAETIKGLIKTIEYTSNADDAYDTASLNSIKSSIGFIRIDHDYVNDETFDQQLLIKRVINPFACLIDSASIECDGSDAMHGFDGDKILVADFKKKYPDKNPVCFVDADNFTKTDKDEITIVDFYEIDEQEHSIGITELGQVESVQDGVVYKNTRVIKKRTVRKYKLSGSDILEETTFPGKYIPLVPVYGEEAWIEGERNLFSLIRKSKDSQKGFNLWKSLEMELLMKQPVAPIMVGAGQIENYMEDWKNPSKAAALRYDTHDKEGNLMPAPQRLTPPQIPTGIVNAARGTVDDIKSTMGLYNASLGQKSNETSGIAIQRRNEEGDIATFHFSDNLVRSIQHAGKIIVYAIPEIYDTPRIIDIEGAEGERKQVGINGLMVDEQEKPHDLTKACYEVRVITGPSYTTKRQEAAEFFSSIVEKQPALMPIMGDLLFKNSDFEGSQAMAERMKKAIDPKYLDENKDQDPQKMQMQQSIQQAHQIMQQMQAEIGNLEKQLQDKQGEVQVKAMAEQGKSETEQNKLQLELYKAQQDAEQKQKENEIKAVELQLKSRELDILEAQILITAQQQDKQMEIDGRVETVKVLASGQQESGIAPDS